MEWYFHVLLCFAWWVLRLVRDGVLLGCLRVQRDRHDRKLVCGGAIQRNSPLAVTIRSFRTLVLVLVSRPFS